MLLGFAIPSQNLRMFWVADVIYKRSFAKMTKKEAAVCLLLALLVENREEKTGFPTQTASLNRLIV